MELAFPKQVQTWWSNEKLYIRVAGEFEAAGHSINVSSEAGNIPTFTILEGYDGSPATGGFYPYDTTVWFGGPYVPNILIIDGRGQHNLSVSRA